jgi:hypothetical protein
MMSRIIDSDSVFCRFFIKGVSATTIRYALMEKRKYLNIMARINRRIISSQVYHYIRLIAYL